MYEELNEIYRYVDDVIIIFKIQYFIFLNNNIYCLQRVIY